MPALFSLDLPTSDIFYKITVKNCKLLNQMSFYGGKTK
jgi:hypothetical protein